MTTRRSLIALFIVAATATATATGALAKGPPPKGWIIAGSRPSAYDFAIDHSIVHGGKASASLKSNVADPGGFGTLMQVVHADNYRNKRVRLSAWVQSDSVANWAGLWLRVDQRDKQEPLAFDNMQDRAIHGTSAWKKYEVVLDVAAEASNIAFGVLVGGAGAVWIDDVLLEEVSHTVPTTGRNAETVSTVPRNLGFEE